MNLNFPRLHVRNTRVSSLRFQRSKKLGAEDHRRVLLGDALFTVQ